MARIKPVVIELKYGIIISLVILVTALFGFLADWKDYYKLVAPNGNLMNWRFVFILILVTALITWFVMNYFWQKEHTLNAQLEQKTQQTIEEYERKIKNLSEDYQLKIDNLRGLLKSSQVEYLSDPITGIPNVKRLEQDFKKFFLTDSKPLAQFIFIDLKNFGEINKTFLSQKANKLIRHIAQQIYLGMRRNENMFKFPASESAKTNVEGGFYRIYPGGDEFVFILDGDQSEALGFINRLYERFKQFSDDTKDILNERRPLSFYCSIVQIEPQDETFQDIFDRAEICYRAVWNAAKADFAISWFPDELENDLSQDSKKAAIYEKTKSIFEVIPVVQRP